MITLVCFFGMIVGLVLFFVGKKQLDALEEYEFNHRSDGGVVGFSSYKDAKQHEKAKKSSAASKSAGAGLAGLFGTGFVIGAILHLTVLH